MSKDKKKAPKAAGDKAQSDYQTDKTAKAKTEIVAKDKKKK